MATSNFTFGAGNPLNTKVDPFAAGTANQQNPTTTPYPTTSVSDLNAANVAARKATESYASPFSTAFGGTAPSTTLDYTRTYASPFSDVFGGTAQSVPYSPSSMVNPVTGEPAGPIGPNGPIAPVTPVAPDKPKNDITKDDRDAFAQLRAIFESYGLGELADTITKLMTEGKSASEALMLLKYDKNYNQAYTARFKGNADRISKGLNALSEAEYISNENAYAETLRAYGLNNMLSTDRKVNQAKFAGYIANDVSSTEFRDRISTVVDNVVNADPAVMNEFKRYYGGLNTNDIVSYFLSPTETLPILKQKAAAASIGAESINQGLGLNTQDRSMELSRLGVTAEQARAGYSNIGEVLPESQKLSSIYQEAGINYDKTAGEQEFLLKNADAQRKRNILASRERANFEGSSGNATLGAYSTAYLKKSSTAGKI